MIKNSKEVDQEVPQAQNTVYQWNQEEDQTITYATKSTVNSSLFPIEVITMLKKSNVISLDMQMAPQQASVFLPMSTGYTPKNGTFFIYRLYDCLF